MKTAIINFKSFLNNENCDNKLQSPGQYFLARILHTACSISSEFRLYLTWNNVLHNYHAILSVQFYKSYATFIYFLFLWIMMYILLQVQCIWIEILFKYRAKLLYFSVTNSYYSCNMIHIEYIFTSSWTIHIHCHYAITQSITLIKNIYWLYNKKLDFFFNYLTVIIFEMYGIKMKSDN